MVSVSAAARQPRFAHSDTAAEGDLADRFETKVTPERLMRLTHASRVLDEILNRAPSRQAPYIGEAAFATKAGIHASAILKEPETYEHVKPESVGNRRRVLVSDQAGKSDILAELERVGIAVSKDDPRVGRMLDEVKRRARRWAMPMKEPTLRSSCWPAG
ncbi:MAG: hypothetical protein R3E48_23075 [Burkholderiaceae bacterium]